MARLILETGVLIIAATARATNRVLLTTDERANFDELPEVRCRLIKIGKDA